MIWCDVFAEEGRFLKRNSRNRRIVCQIVPLPHRLILDELSELLEQAGMISLTMSAPVEVEVFSLPTK
jgi:hypothetical protein